MIFVTCIVFRLNPASRFIIYFSFAALPPPRSALTANLYTGSETVLINVVLSCRFLTDPPSQECGLILMTRRPGPSARRTALTRKPHSSPRQRTNGDALRLPMFQSVLLVDALITESDSGKEFAEVRASIVGDLQQDGVHSSSKVDGRGGPQ